MDAWSGTTPLRRRLRRLASLQRRDEAVAFIQRHHSEQGLGSDARRTRVAEVERLIRRYGTYEHTPEELAFGARLAWRNNARCVGRLFWESLDVVDCRHLRDPDAVAARCFEHLSDSIDGGRIRSVMSVFTPVSFERVPPYVESRQLTMYAGWTFANGDRRGDSANIEQTRVAQSLGWLPSGEWGDFDLLPLMIRDEKDRRLLYEVPRGRVREIPLRHPSSPAFAELGLRWYAVPVMSSMILTIGGVDYHCAPFNGFYMGTEVASRNLADEHRYNKLPCVADALGISQTASPLWRDETLTELNRAVLHSFATEGVTMLDHHTASRQYMEFTRRERAAGREPSGNWAWVVPPQASAGCPVFHTGMKDRRLVPGIYHSRADDGADLAPDWPGGEDRPTSRYARWRRRRQQRLADAS